MGATRIEKNTAKLMLTKLRSRLDSLFNEQEALKAKTGKSQPQFNQKMELGGFAQLMKSKENEQLGGMFNNMTTTLSGTNDIRGAGVTGGNVIPDTKFDWANAGMTALGAAPILYNLGQGMFNKPQQLNAQEFYNPYENDVRSAMRNRRFNARPLLERNMASQNAYNKNVRSVAGSRGELLSNYGAGYAARMRADAEGYTIKDNQDNAYLGEQAQMDNNLGQQISQTKLGVQNMNDQNTAAHRNFLSASATQGSQWAQNQQLMKNQRTTDVFRGEAIKGMAPYLENWAPETWKYIAEQGRKKGYIS